MAILVSVLAALLVAAPGSGGENWPQFRGPQANGHADAEGLPLRWSEKEHVVWKTPIHDLGWSSPVIWKEAIWLTTATSDGHQAFAVCIDRGSGRIVRDVKVFDTAKPEHVATSNSYASPTPVVEDGRLYVHYGTYGTACLDTASGKLLWTRRDLNCDHHEGPGSSPMLWGNLLIIDVDGRDVQYVIALDKATGKTVWKTNRSVDYSKFPENIRKAFCTPILIEPGGRLQLISPGAKAMMGYDPASGEELWKVRYDGWSVTPRPVFGHGLIFLVTDYERPELVGRPPRRNGRCVRQQRCLEDHQGSAFPPFAPFDRRPALHGQFRGHCFLRGGRNGPPGLARADQGGLLGFAHLCRPPHLLLQSRGNGHRHSAGAKIHGCRRQ